MFIPTSIATLLVQNLLPSYQNNLPIDSSISATTGPMFTLSPSGNSIPMSTGKQEKRAIPTMIYDDVTTTANCTTTSIVTVTRGRREDGVIEADNADSAYTDVFQTSVLDSYSIGTGVAPTSTLDSHETKSWRNQWR
jgi:hypothetical protein